MLSKLNCKKIFHFKKLTINLKNKIICTGTYLLNFWPLKKRVGSISGSFIVWYESADPVPYQNVTYPEH
jgi:hypothetical protein